MLMTQSLTIINQFPDHPFAHPSWSWETATATTGKYINPMLPALLQIWVCSCYRKATFLTCGLRFLYQWSCFHFVTLPMTLAALPNNPLPLSTTMDKHFLLVKFLASPTLITAFPLLYFLMVTS